MATIKKGKIEKVVTKKIDGYILELTEKEAIILRYICGSITGSNTSTGRKITDAIYHSFRELDVPVYEWSKVSGSLTFLEDRDFLKDY